MKVIPSISAETKSCRFPQKLKSSTSLIKSKKIQTGWDPVSMSVTTAPHSRALRTIFSNRLMLQMWYARNLLKMNKNSTWLWHSHSRCRVLRTSTASKHRASKNRRFIPRGLKLQSIKIYCKSSVTELNKRIRSKKSENNIWVLKSRSKSRWWKGKSNNNPSKFPLRSSRSNPRRKCDTTEVLLIFNAVQPKIL